MNHEYRITKVKSGALKSQGLKFSLSFTDTTVFDRIWILLSNTSTMHRMQLYEFRWFHNKKIARGELPEIMWATKSNNTILAHEHIRNGKSFAIYVGGSYFSDAETPDEMRVAMTELELIHKMSAV